MLLVRLLAVLLLIAPSTLRAQEARGLDPARVFRVATWNLLNLFDDVDEPDRPDEGTDPKSLADLKALVAAIDALDVDVLGVQEVENRRILERLNRHLARPFLHVELIEGNDFRGIDVGLLSRVPVVRAASHRLRPLRDGQGFARDFPLFRLRPCEGLEVEIGVVHLKSKRGRAEESDAWRRAEAEGIRSILAESRRLEPKVPVLVMGDFNDRRGAATLEPLFSFLEDPTARLVPEDGRWTFEYRGEKEQIDFVLASEGIEARAARIPEIVDSPSDHRPVVVDFVVPAPVLRAEGPAGEPWPEDARPEVAAVDLPALEARLLQEIRLRGRVTKVHKPGSGARILNFHEDYKRAATVYVPREAVERFPGIDELVGREVRIDGPVSRRRDVFQVRLTRPEQLEVKTARPR